MKYIELSKNGWKYKGMFKSIVDDNIFIDVNGKNWSYSSHGYASRIINHKYIAMHRYIYELINGEIPIGLEIDHINHNGLDNRIKNLRLVTKTQNQMNSKITLASSRFKGVTFDKQTEKWRSRIWVDNKPICLGRFSVEIEAAEAYNKAAIKYHGEYAYLNEIQ